MHRAIVNERIPFHGYKLAQFVTKVPFIYDEKHDTMARIMHKLRCRVRKENHRALIRGCTVDLRQKFAATGKSLDKRQLNSALYSFVSEAKAMSFQYDIGNWAYRTLGTPL
ncbi:hypothetical protein MoryE10_11850 [Methylogaea oryzae]|uniref:Uncharacterized protein n=1 Tax=Methylogaea oryzae TaxID=1295382 RepID=A0A8D4VQ30_9GAMM|nr:hypothetical protein MoryE10_11850 [Methylogaea oryzae]